MKYLPYLLVILLIIITGCKSDKVNVTVPNGFGVGRISALADMAIEQKPQPATVKKALELIKSETVLVEQVIRTDATIIAEQQVQNSKLKAQKEWIEADIKTHWVGQKTKDIFNASLKWLKWVVIIWFAAGAIGFFLSLKGGILGTIGNEILDFLFAANPFRWVYRVITGKKKK